MKRLALFLTAALFLVAAGVAPLLAAGPNAGAPAKALTADQIKALIGKLGDADFKTRAAAQKELVEAGPAVLPALEEAARSSDAEIKQRAADAIKEIRDAIAAVASAELAKNYLWSFNIANGVMYGPAVAAGRAYAIGRDWRLYAVDIKTGKEAWNAELPAKASAQMSAGEKVLAVAQGANLIVYEAKEGKKLWEKDLGGGAAAPGGAAPGPVGPGGGIKPPIKAVPLDGDGAGAAGNGEAAPAQAGPPVAVPPIRFAPIQPVATASAPASGPAKGPAAGPIQGGPPVARPPIVVAGPIRNAPFMLSRTFAWVAGDVVVARAADKLRAFKALTGEDAWEMDFKATGFVNCNSIVAGNVLYASKGTAVAAIDLAAHKELWSKDISQCAGLALGGGTLICVNNAGTKMIALDARKGDQLWEQDLPGTGAVGVVNAPVTRLNLRNRGSEAPIVPVDDSKVYLVVGEELITFDLKKGDKAAVKLDLGMPKGENEADQAAAGGAPAPGPGGAAGFIGVTNKNLAYSSARWIVSGDKLYVIDADGLFAFESKSGQRLWMLPMKQQMPAGDPVVADGVIYFATYMFSTSALRPGGMPDEKALPKDLPGLHAVKLQK
ncbi:MAG: PQQ-binding-like beta-propeller repeat protein [Phycisphaerae bacterium]